MKYIAFNIVALVCIGGALYLAAVGKDGWGWFLFVGLLCVSSITFHPPKKD